VRGGDGEMVVRWWGGGVEGWNGGEGGDEGGMVNLFAVLIGVVLGPVSNGKSSKSKINSRSL
jgi:hypothetical protein